MSLLTLRIDHDDRAWLAILQQIAGVPYSWLGQAVGSAAATRCSIFLPTHGF
ncbi:hypothetical protein [Paracoccus sanguinis]|uniref:hypothetical protein n=1 Tax=Paracoccus sanguinis TaxID=1545044 RepID=UPI000B1444B4|nr:hypothetical protein [Paracoccus sanguinis]